MRPAPHPLLISFLLRGSLLAAPATTVACQPTCTGVGCEEQFAGALIGVLPGVDLKRGAVSPLDAAFTLAGTKDLGPEADVALLSHAAWVGTAGDNAVRRYDLSTTADLGTDGVAWPSVAAA